MSEKQKATQFKMGHASHNKVPVGLVSIKPQSVRNKDRLQAWVKIGEPNVWTLRSRLVWEVHHGALPEGRILYHTDGDSLNDDIGNLEAITRAEACRRTTASLPLASLIRRGRKARRTRLKNESRLTSLSVDDLKRRGYTHYCPVCEKPSKSARLTCHKAEEAVRL